MGCDIHIHTEVKIQGIWRHWGTPNVNRRYKLFEKMAGVRGSIEHAIVAPKGLPKDVTFETQFDFDRYPEEWHSMSWLSLEEIKKMYEWWDSVEKTNSYGLNCIEEQFGYLLSDGWDEIKDTEIEDVRWVFWFDN